MVLEFPHPGEDEDQLAQEEPGVLGVMIALAG